MKKNFKILAATMMAFVMTIAMTGCGSETGVSREEPTTVVSNTTETSQKEETVTQEPVVEEPVTQETETQEPSTETTALTGPVEFTIATVGGMYFDENIVNAANEAGGYDYLFEDVKPLIEEADVAIGVIQTPLKDKESFKIAKAIANAGFDVINVATTNVADNGEIDFNATLGQPHTNGMEVCGATSQAYPYDKIAYVNVQGAKVAFISGAEGVVSEEGRYEINTIDEGLIVSQIEEAKSEGAVVIVVSLNYVDNGQEKLEKEKEDFINRLGSAGAQIVLCSGLNHLVKAGGDMDFANGIYGRFLASQGCFISSETNSASIFKINVKVNEDGSVSVMDYPTHARAIYIDSNDHYRLVPVTAEEAASGDYPDDFKAHADFLYMKYREIDSNTY